MNLSRLWLLVAAVILGTALAVDTYVEHMQPRPVLAASLPADSAFTGHLEALWSPEGTPMRRGCPAGGSLSGRDSKPGNGFGGGCDSRGRRPWGARHLPYPGLDLLGVKQVCGSSEVDSPAPPQLPVGSGFVQ
ncbi:MAG: hypothetical protein GC161_13650 [Planctomycetaceae bacterium]|nr:hypothetical protein [Planctomycetaceae bacterium]